MDDLVSEISLFPRSRRRSCAHSRPHRAPSPSPSRPLRSVLSVASQACLLAPTRGPRSERPSRPFLPGRPRDSPAGVGALRSAAAGSFRGRCPRRRALSDGAECCPTPLACPAPPNAPPRPRPASWWCTWCDSPRRSCCHDGDTDGGGGEYTPASHRVTTPAPWLTKPSTAVGGAGVPRAAHMASLWPRRPRRCTAGGPLEECRGAPLVVQLWSRRCHVAPGSIRSPALHRLQWQRRLEPGAEPLELARRRGALKGTLRP